MHTSELEEESIKKLQVKRKLETSSFSGTLFFFFFFLVPTGSVQPGLTAMIQILLLQITVFPNNKQTNKQNICIFPLAEPAFQNKMNYFSFSTYLTILRVLQKKKMVVTVVFIYFF